MIAPEIIAQAFANTFNPMCLFLIWFGTVIGIIFGSIPGLSATMAVVLFLFINSDHKISLKASVLSVLPVILYALVYLVLVFAVGEQAGGWRDHYQIGDVLQVVPLYLLFPLLCLVSFGVSALLRAVHNRIHEKRKAETERYYQSAGAFDHPDLPSAIKALADLDRPHDKGGELTVPRRIMRMMEKKYASGLSAREMCRIYIDEYFRDVKGG